MRDLLISQLRAILDGKDPNRVPEHSSVQVICTKQQQIKWDQLLRGRFATEWATHHRTQPAHQHKSTQNWTVEVIDFIFTQWWQLWELRNQDRHGRDLATQQQAHAQQIDRELHMFYTEYEPSAPQHLRWIFDTPLDVRRQWTPYAIRQWLNTWQPLLHKARNPEAAPTNPENYPYSTALETG